jgi:hypothetical protein
MTRRRFEADSSIWLDRVKKTDTIDCLDEPSLEFNSMIANLRVTNVLEIHRDAFV